MYEELARGFGFTAIELPLKSDKANGARRYTPSGLAAVHLAPIGGQSAASAGLPTRRGRADASGPRPFAAAPPGRINAIEACKNQRHMFSRNFGTRILYLDLHSF